ncbi:MAG: DUF3667 domain-containing protein [Alphaproteobacteria bacterium]|nr:DUF3667 domain-containing protein [Alphaproteobacteria bacterium]MDE1985282.1 DUF3667 domain-containing protein [Alphaproteobacteria bacterium]MDE2162621.1 DUF3667 domain-containing protein [Alphaproteobacteria bacterium]MDE2498619.1 DUF3667 domain-containing protein [Alphaproteobacteria bacterium]
MDDLGAILETGGAAAVELAASALAERGAKTVQCANCSEPLIGPYCAVCGQPHDTHRRSLQALLHDLVKDIISFDSRILRTARALMFEPGELALAFRQGRTQRYVPAVRLYLFVSLIFFLTLTASHIAIVQMVPVVTPEKIVVEHGKTYAMLPNGKDKIPVPAFLNDGRPHFAVSVNNAVFFAREGALHVKVPPGALEDMARRLKSAEAKSDSSLGAHILEATRRTTTALAADPAALNGALTSWIPRALFLLLPLFALLMAAFYWRQRKDVFFVDHLVFSLGFHTFGFALLLVAAGLAQVLSDGVVAWLVISALGLYLLFAMRRFYQQNWFWTGAKFITVSAIYTVFFVIPAVFGIFIASVFYG